MLYSIFTSVLTLYTLPIQHYSSVFLQLLYQNIYGWGFPGGSVVRNLPNNAGDAGLTSGEGNGNPHQYSCPENSKDRGLLVGYSPWGHKRVGHDLATKQQHIRSAFYTLLSTPDPNF